MDIPSREDLKVALLGEANIPSPLEESQRTPPAGGVLVSSDTESLAWDGEHRSPPYFEAAGPRPTLFFDPEKTTCGIVTCGGLCPGLNDVIRSIVLTLHHSYGVRRILGFRYGYAGLTASRTADPVLLEPTLVENIHLQGGTLLGTSRGPQDVGEMVDQLMTWKVKVLFAIGGDGALSGASAIAEEVGRRGLAISVIGVPKTIDNDLTWTERSFGFSTAVEEARGVIDSAHGEAYSHGRGVGLVKLMGRHSGFIAAHATLSSGDVNFCLIPEVPFDLEGEGGLFHALGRRLEERGHAVVVVAEGAGQQHFGPDRGKRDQSGNVRLGDIGVFLRDRIVNHFQDVGAPVILKYIDPSYTIRTRPTDALDSGFCLMLGQHAVHAGLSGRTDMMIGFWNHRFTHVPLCLVKGRRKQVQPQGEVWHRVLATTGQPVSLRSARR